MLYIFCVKGGERKAGKERRERKNLFSCWRWCWSMNWNVTWHPEVHIYTLKSSYEQYTQISHVLHSYYYLNCNLCTPINNEGSFQPWWWPHLFKGPELRSELSIENSRMIKMHIFNGMSQFKLHCITWFGCIMYVYVHRNKVVVTFPSQELDREKRWMCVRCERVRDKRVSFPTHFVSGLLALFASGVITVVQNAYIGYVRHNVTHDFCRAEFNPSFLPSAWKKPRPRHLDLNINRNVYLQSAFALRSVNQALALL